MAEYVKWRFTKLRAGVTMALFGLLAGLGIRTAEGSHPATVVADRAASSGLAHNSITSAQVKTHSLLLSDFKLHEVASYASVKTLETKLATDVNTINAALKQNGLTVSGLLKIDDANATFLKIDDANIKWLKIDDANARFLKIDDANAKWLKIDDANAKFLAADATAANADKIDGLDSSQIVQGHGQVISGTAAIGGAPVALMSVPGLVSISVVKPAGALKTEVTITNVSGQTLLINGDPAGNGATVPVAAGAALLPAVQLPDGGQATLQVMAEGGSSQVVTLNFSAFGDGSVHTLVGQALVGSP